MRPKASLSGPERPARLQADVALVGGQLGVGADETTQTGGLGRRGEGDEIVPNPIAAEDGGAALDGGHRHVSALASLDQLPFEVVEPGGNGRHQPGRMRAVHPDLDRGHLGVKGAQRRAQGPDGREVNASDRKAKAAEVEARGLLGRLPRRGRAPRTWYRP